VRSLVAFLRLASICFFELIAAALAPRPSKQARGARERSWWNFEAECLRSLEIDHQFVLARCLYRQVGRLFAKAAAGVADIKGKMANGFAAGGKNFKVHLDGYDFTVLPGQLERRAARRDLLLRPGRQPQCDPLERNRLGANHEPADGPVRTGS
jgi:hypothetical protein